MDEDDLVRVLSQQRLWKTGRECSKVNEGRAVIHEADQWNATQQLSYSSTNWPVLHIYTVTVDMLSLFVELIIHPEGQYAGEESTFMITMLTLFSILV